MTPAAIAVIGGDGIGPEVVGEALKVLHATVGENDFTFVNYDLGADRWQRTGEILPDSVLEELKQMDAILLGAVGAAPGSKTIQALRLPCLRRSLTRARSISWSFAKAQKASTAVPVAYWQLAPTKRLPPR